MVEISLTESSLKMKYPSWRYHKSEEPKVIHSEDQEHPDWKHSPACFEEKEELSKESEEIQEIKEEVKEVKTKKKK